uniref:NAD(P)H-quinone oxidoreductase subunit 6, chloroplastic n=1 Tax=Cibotium barometz TaxID=29588 RepID=A0A2S1PVA1_CIBBA|nr:NADH-plastoquinone oxidoreductase subunit 6 [Cibotium barometz]YP_010878776.1 NADH dehydrogenase subunit G [Cibotium cumingii]WHE38231.1 NADH dehydrogenase subunit G [Cibotium sinoburmaense]AWH62755.1 NADH-plastoquinone oxidoreductase subunit 6 [Cibotium barometz]WHE37969.1 NADH dehydrogenase subunit G [Cibotium barometz]WHE38056.1 NADH dehydrogenase subunit G [Cibotium barometz]WHE38144.1 NADH dehydrogenase subunit G [Cibotium barometz]
MNLSESVHEAILTLLELGILLGSLGVVALANVVHSAFLPGLVFTRISLSYIVLNADFVAAAQSLVYVGAINVLIVSAVTVTDEPTSSNSPTNWSTGHFITLGACTGLSSLLTIMINSTKWSNICFINRSKILVGETPGNNVQELGYQLLTTFLVPFELLSILLLVALIGAITLARNEEVTTMNEGSVSSSRNNSSFF